MKKKRIFIIIGIVVAVIVAVLTVLLIINKKSETPTNTTNVDGVVLKENVIVITDKTDNNLQPYKIDENNLYFKKNPKYQENYVVVSGITKTAPNGYIRKIVKIEETNGEFILKTEPATFLDVFEVLHFTATIELTEDGNGNFSVDEKTKNALSILPKLSLSATNKTTAKNSTSKDKKSDDSTDDNSKRKNLFEIEFDEDIDDEVHIQGNASAKVWLELKIDIENNEITWSLTANDEIQSHILLGFGASLEKEFEKELFSKQLPNIQIMAGPVPIVLTNEVGANLEFEAGIAGEIGTSIDITQTSKNGFVYTSKDGSVKEINDGEMSSGGVECTTGTKATGGAKAGVILSLTTLFYDCSGAELGLGVEASAEGEITLNTKTLATEERYYGKLALAISPCISGNIIVQIPVIDDDLYEMEIFKVELKPFWEKVWENKKEEQDDTKKENQKNIKTYITRYKKTDGSEIPQFQFSYRDNWTIKEESLNADEYTLEKVVLVNERGVEIEYFCFNMKQIGGAGRNYYEANVTKLSNSQFISPDSEKYTVAKIHETKWMHADMHTDYQDVNNYIYAVCPENLLGEQGYANYLDKFSLKCYPIHISFSTKGKLNKTEEKEVAEILSSFKVYNPDASESTTNSSRKLWEQTYDKIIETTLQQKQNNDYISWGTLCGAPGTEINIGGVGATVKLNSGDEFVYLLKEVNTKQNNIPELFIGIRNGDSVKIAVVFEFIDNNTPNWGITGPYASTILGVIDDNKDRIELYSNGIIVQHSEYGETVYHDGELDFDYQGNLSSLELVDITSLPWKPIESFN